MRLAALVLSAFCTSLAQGQTVRVLDDPRSEAIGLLFRVAGASDFNDGAVQPYMRQIDSAFAPFRGHAVFTEINRLRKQHGLSLSAVTTMAPQISDPATFGERAPLEASSSGLDRAWGGTDARVFLAEARDFNRVAHLDAFLRDHQSLYDSATVRMRRMVSGGHLEWISRFFGEDAGDTFVVSPLLVSARGNFGADFTNGIVHERYAFMAVPRSDSLGFPVMDPGALPIVVHEFNHSFVNHVVATRAKELQAAGERVRRAVQEPMRALAYDSWPTIINESVVRAGVIRYLLSNEGQEIADKETRLQRGMGFVWMDDLVALLGEYESHRSLYPTFAAFMPRIVEFYDGLAPRVERLVSDFDQRRPRIVAASIPDSATTVDPRLDVIELHFDRPVDAIITIVGNHEGGTPPFTTTTFDATHTSIRLGIKLEPGRDYILPLGPGVFVDRDGYPLRNFMLHFRTSGP